MLLVFYLYIANQTGFSLESDIAYTHLANTVATTSKYKSEFTKELTLTSFTVGFELHARHRNKFLVNVVVTDILAWLNISSHHRLRLSGVYIDD